MCVLYHGAVQKMPGESLPVGCLHSYTGGPLLNTLNQARDAPLRYSERLPGSVLGSGCNRRTLLPGTAENNLRDYQSVRLAPVCTDLTGYLISVTCLKLFHL